MIQRMFSHPPTTHRPRWRRLLWLAAVLLPILATLQGSAPVQAARGINAASSPYDVLNLVNQLRAANGMPALAVNAALMAAAQGHSEYQASVHSITHYGPGGNSAKERAAAAGYGGGAAFFLSENIYGGTNANAQQAVTWWQGDAPHMNTMIGANYTDAGVGVASDGSLVYYTLDVGYLSGSPASGGTPPAAGAVTPITFNPVDISTPMPDGSIIHVVQSGQTLWTIAAIYKTELTTLQKLNGFNEWTFIYPGQKVLVKGPEIPPTITPTGTATLTPFVRPSSTRRSTATEVSQLPAAVEAENQLASQPAPTRVIDPLLVIIGVFVGGGVLLFVVGSLLSRRSQAK